MVLRTLRPWVRSTDSVSPNVLQVSAGVLDLNQGTLYPALLRLEQRG